MSELLIKMKKPESCAGCYMFLHGIDMDGTPWHECAVADCETDNPFGCGKPDWCPLVKVSPHGRLIDVDAVLDGLAHKLGLRSLDYLTPSERAIVSWFKDAPTVIPASEEGE